MNKNWSDIEKWEPVTDTDAEALVRLAVPYVRWLSPTLVALLAADNTIHQASWQRILAQSNILSDLYLWPGSACAYPGRRRKTGSREKAGKPAEQCLATDTSGNNLAHRVWELLGNGQRNFVQSRPGYELVHLFPHKAVEWKKLLRLLDEKQPTTTALLPAGWRSWLETHGLPGLFTNPANMCFVPNTFVRPTDGHSLFRQVLWKRALTLFGSEALLPLPVAEAVAGWLNPLPAVEDLEWNPLYHGLPEKLPALLRDRSDRLTKYESIYFYPGLKPLTAKALLTQ
jgi:hypothetical protein